jgi:ABC-type transporter Mla MlaB component
MQDTARSSKWSLRLPRDCSISSIRGVYDLIVDAFGRQQSLEIDGSDVAKADVTSVQLLVSAAQTAQLEGRSVVLTSPSQALSSTFQRAGLASNAGPEVSASPNSGGK